VPFQVCKVILVCHSRFVRLYKCAIPGPMIEGYISVPFQVCKVIYKCAIPGL